MPPANHYLTPCENGKCTPLALNLQKVCICLVRFYQKVYVKEQSS